MLEIENNIEVIERNVNEIKKKQHNILSSPFSEEGEHYELETLMAEIQHLSTVIWAKLKSTKETLKKNELSKNLNVDVRMKNIQLNGLTHRLMEVLGEYNTIQIDYKGKKKNLLKRQLEITGQAVQDDELEKMLDTENTAIFTQGYIMETQRARECLIDIEERYSELQKIENSIRELNDMFLNLSMLVNNQGDFIDVIEEHVSLAGANVKKGNIEFQEAAIKQRKARKRKICIILILTVICVVIIILVALLSK